MPQAPQNNMKGTSPSPLMQRVIDQSWGQQKKSSESPQQMIDQQFNQNPVPPGDTTKTK